MMWVEPMYNEEANRANQATSDYLDRKDALLKRNPLMGQLARMSDRGIFGNAAAAAGIFALGAALLGGGVAALALIALAVPLAAGLKIAQSSYLHQVESELEDQDLRASVFETTLRDERVAAGYAGPAATMPDLRSGFPGTQRTAENPAVEKPAQPGPAAAVAPAPRKGQP